MDHPMRQNRRTFLTHAGTGLGAVAVASVHDHYAAAMQRGAVVGKGLPKNWRTMRKIDVHNHVWGAVHRPNANWAPVEDLIEAAANLGINQILCSSPITAGAMASIEAVREVNDAVLAAMKRYPDTIMGYCFVQPGNGQAALDEIERCLAAGMIGVKLYNQFKYSDPVIFPIAERCIHHRILFLGHSAHLTDPKSLALQPKTSDSLDFCVLSRRYPELLLILGHVNGGGDWEWAVKGLSDCPGVYLDISGSGLDDRTIETCVKELGHKRVLFGTDSTMEGSVGKVLSASLTTEQRADIFWRNTQSLLARRKQ